LKLTLPVSRGAGSFEAAVSGFNRLYEEYGVDEITIVHVTALNEAKMVKGFIEKYFSEVSVELKGLSTHAVVEYQTNPLPRILRKSYFEGSPGLILVSSAGRRLAASVALAGFDKDHEIVHVNFYWGPWTGLYYPYTPRRLEPIVVMHSALEPHSWEEVRSVADRVPDLSTTHCILPGLGDLTPLRCAVAELARRLNKARGFVRGPPLSHKCGMLRVSLETIGEWKADLCDHNAVGDLLYRFARAVNMWASEVDPHRLAQILAWSGASPLKFDGAMPMSVIADTSLLYHGIHNYVYEGLPITIPECAVAEIMSNVAEAVKRKKRDPQSFATILAYLALVEARRYGASIVPSGPRPCDTGVTRIDPILVDGTTLVTSDSGAYNLWRVHPISRLAKPLHIYYNPEETIKPDPLYPETLSRTYYALLQLIIAVILASKLQILDSNVKVQVETDETTIKAQPPTSILLEAVGFKVRTKQ